MLDNLLMGFGAWFVQIAFIALFCPSYLEQTVAGIREGWNNSPSWTITRLSYGVGMKFLAVWLMPPPLFLVFVTITVAYTMYVLPDIPE
jgi:hypothetical protein